MFTAILTKSPSASIFLVTRSKASAPSTSKPSFHKAALTKSPSFPSWGPVKTAKTSPPWPRPFLDRKSTRLNSSHVRISYAVFCLKKKKQTKTAAQVRSPGDTLRLLVVGELNVLRVTSGCEIELSVVRVSCATDSLDDNCAGFPTL